MNVSLKRSLGLLSLLGLSASGLPAAISESEAARLGQDLTPIGAIRAGNADGTIPAWTGGVTTAPPGWQPGTHHIDPFAGDRPLFTITAANHAQYADRLPAGLVALMRAYPETFRLPIYPTRRSAAFPQRVYDATRANATTARLADRGNGVTGSVVGIPFPIPQTGQEVIWNHLLRYRGVNVSRAIGQAAPTRDGNFTLVILDEEFYLNYHREGITEAQLNNIAFFFRQTVTAPARLAGSILLVHETLNQVKEPRSAWLYNPGMRRVRRAPNVAYDNPGTASDGMRTSDQLDMFNGAIDRYDWNLVGRKEMFVPYNSYKLHSSDVKHADILRPLHLNQDLARYELHRVWVVEAILKPGTSHIYPRRTFYIDEDSWQVLVVDQYDARGQMWRVSEAHCVQFYDALTFWSTIEVHTDLLAGRYLALGLDNETRPYDFSARVTAEDFTPGSLRREGVR